MSGPISELAARLMIDVTEDRDGNSVAKSYVELNHERHLARNKILNLLEEVKALREALAGCAERFKRCMIAGGTSEEYAEIAVEDYRTLARFQENK